ncbi:MAG: radical SAM protein [bacterium]
MWQELILQRRLQKALWCGRGACLTVRNRWRLLLDELINHTYEPEAARTVEAITHHEHNLFGYPNEERGLWLELEGNSNRQYYEREKAEVVYFVGCQSSFLISSHQQALGVLKELADEGVDFAVLGSREWCCGMPFKRLEMNEEFESYRQHNLREVGKIGAEEDHLQLPLVLFYVATGVSAGGDRADLQRKQPLKEPSGLMDFKLKGRIYESDENGCRQNPGEYQAAWEIGRQNFGHRISFYAPTIKRYETEEFAQSCGHCYFMPVSLTGASCELNCDHCGRKILAAMKAAITPEDLFKYAREIAGRGAKGMLISGGSTREGVVLIRPFLSTLGWIKEEFGFKIVAHLGILDEETVREIAKSGGIDGAMMDIVGADETLREVYHLPDLTTEDFEDSLRLLCDYGIKTIPHVVIGLHYGRIVGEHDALEIISRYPVEAVVLVGLLPQIGTPMAEINPPTPEEMGEIFQEARRLFPKTPVLLGCQRPLGEHKLKTDRLALEAGLNGIAYPAEGVVSLAKKMGLNPHFSQMCCSLVAFG